MLFNVFWSILIVGDEVSDAEVSLEIIYLLSDYYTLFSIGYPNGNGTTSSLYKYLYTILLEGLGVIKY